MEKTLYNNLQKGVHESQKALRDIRELQRNIKEYTVQLKDNCCIPRKIEPSPRRPKSILKSKDPTPHKSPSKSASKDDSSKKEVVFKTQKSKKAEVGVNTSFAASNSEQEQAPPAKREALKAFPLKYLNEEYCAKLQRVEQKKQDSDKLLSPRITQLNKQHKSKI